MQLFAFYCMSPCYTPECLRLFFGRVLSKDYLGAWSPLVPSSPGLPGDLQRVWGFQGKVSWPMSNIGSNML